MCTHCLRSWRPCFQDSWLLSDPEDSFSLASSAGGEEDTNQDSTKQRSLWHYFHSVNTTRTFLHHSILATTHIRRFQQVNSGLELNRRGRCFSLIRASEKHTCTFIAKITKHSWNSHGQEYYLYLHSNWFTFGSIWSSVIVCQHVLL